MKYNFRNLYSLTDHYNKHVLGNGAMDPREPQQFQKKVHNEGQYLEVANENIKNAKRVFNYTLDNGKRSYNYQKENISYKPDMSDEEYEGLLTTCLNDKKENINTCFYRTINYSNIELIAMAVAIYTQKYIMADGFNLHFDGFHNSSFPKNLIDSFTEIYKEYEIDLHYAFDDYINLVIIKFINKNIKEYQNGQNRLNRIIWHVFKDLSTSYLAKSTYNPTEYYKKLDDKYKNTYEKFIIKQLENAKDDFEDNDDIISLIYNFAIEIKDGPSAKPSLLFKLFTKE